MKVDSQIIEDSWIFQNKTTCPRDLNMAFEVGLGNSAQVIHEYRGSGKNSSLRFLKYQDYGFGANERNKFICLIDEFTPQMTTFNEPASCWLDIGNIERTHQPSVEKRLEELEGQFNNLVNSTWSYIFSNTDRAKMKNLSRKMLKSSAKARLSVQRILAHPSSES